MKYRAIKNRWITVQGEETIDAGDGLILIPPENQKVFLHWLNANGKLLATYTMTYATLVTDKVKIVSQERVRIHVLEP